MFFFRCWHYHQQLFLYLSSTDRYPQFFTADIFEWNPLLKQDKYKRIIVDSLQFLVKSKRVKVFCLCYYTQSYSAYMASAVAFYKTGGSNFDFITHYAG